MMEESSNFHLIAIVLAFLPTGAWHEMVFRVKIIKMLSGETSVATSVGPLQLLPGYLRCINVDVGYGSCLLHA